MDFDTWYVEARPPLAAALTVWCADGSAAADALDEAFVRALERWDRVGAMASPRGWVWQTALNVLRRSARRQAIEARLLRRQAASARAEVTAPGIEAIDLLDALKRLPPRQRTAVVLFYIADLPVRDVAAAMDVAEGTVHATLHHARGRLSEYLVASDDSATGDAERPTDGVVR